MIKNNKNKGFTLIEILIALTIFSFMVLAISGIYIAFTKSQARTKTSQQLLNDSQYVLEIMAREIRSSEILDYNPSGVGGRCTELLGSHYADCILLLRPNGSVVAFAAEDGSVSGYRELIYVVLDCNLDYSSCTWDTDYASTVLISPNLNDIELSPGGLSFNISPSTNPYDDIDSNQQPIVTIKLNTEYASTKRIEQIDYHLQTSVSSRIYKR